MFGGEEAWVYRDAQRVIPVGTRWILATVEADWRLDQQNDSFADGLSVSIDLAELLEPILVKKPMLQGTESNSQKIIWETDGVDHDPVVLWGENLENRATNIKSTWVDDGHIVHVAVIEGFEAGETVRYQVPIEELEPAVFQTAPQRDSDFSIAWLGDNQEAYTRFTSHVSHISDRNPNMLFVVGDLIQTSSIHNEWQQMWWDPLQEKDFAQYTQVLAARGNHDLDHPYSYAYVDLPQNGSHYSFLYGDVFILVLNTHADLYPSADPNIYGQYNFLVDELNSPKARNAEFRIVAFHQAPYSNSSASQGLDQIQGLQGARDFWVPIFEEQDVDIVISGHYHSYQRGKHNGIMYLVTGGGGSTLLVQEFNYWDWLSLDLVYQYTMMHREEGRLRFETYNLEDQLIDSFDIE
jgi:UDP-2,3-diacylglucosamine pyrophosphatase LpxH